MARQTDENRVLLLLENGGMSNQAVKTTLSLSDKRYQDLKLEMLNANLIELYRRRGGGVRLTNKGLDVSKSNAVRESVESVKQEKDLYLPFEKSLRSEVLENEEGAFVLEISKLKTRGKWKNPDLMKVSVEQYPLQRVNRVLITTYEVKKWRSWNVESVFEAASHKQFSHRSYLVLEWVKDEPYEIGDYLESTCSRLGVGLMILVPHYNGFRHEVKIHPETNIPFEGDVEDFMESIFEKVDDAQKNYEELWKL